MDLLLASPSLKQKCILDNAKYSKNGWNLHFTSTDLKWIADINFFLAVLLLLLIHLGRATSAEIELIKIKSE